MNKQIEFQKAIEDNNVKTVKKLLTQSEVNPSNNVSISIRTAAKFGYIDIVKLLLNDKRADPTTRSKNVIKLNTFETSVLYQQSHIVELLLKDKRVDPSFNSNRCIIMCSDDGNLEIVDLLWKDKRVKDTLQNDYKELYDQLIKKDIKNKIELF
jgi:hypothetical protein